MVHLFKDCGIFDKVKIPDQLKNNFKIIKKYFFYLKLYRNFVIYKKYEIFKFH